MKTFSAMIRQEVQEIDNYMKKRRAHRATLRHPHMKQILARLDAVPSLEEAERITVYQGYSFEPGREAVDFHVELKQEVKDPQFARDLIRGGLAHKLTKRVAYGGSSLTISGRMFEDLALAFKVSITITGYVPSTCKIVYEDVVIPEHIEKKAKVICGPDELDASATGTDLEEPVTI